MYPSLYFIVLLIVLQEILDMYPEDRVLVGVIYRKRDLTYALNDHWYRIPQKQMPRSVHTEYVAFFLSRAFGERNGGVYYYAELKGLELAYRKDLLPKEANHRRADEVYYRLALGELREKTPPILNPTKRTIAFVYTTWDRFVGARQISDLYSKADIFVDRIEHALNKRGYTTERTWEAERRPPSLRVLWDGGAVLASTAREDNTIYLDSAQTDDEILRAIYEAIARNGGPATLGIPFEGL